MKEKFIGGRGYGLKLLWDATKPDTNGMTLKTKSIFLPAQLAVLLNIPAPENRFAFPFHHKPISLSTVMSVVSLAHS